MGKKVEGARKSQSIRWQCDKSKEARARQQEQESKGEKVDATMGDMAVAMGDMARRSCWLRAIDSVRIKQTKYDGGLKH